MTYADELPLCIAPLGNAVRDFESRKTVRRSRSWTRQSSAELRPTSEFWRIRLQEYLTALPSGARLVLAGRSPVPHGTG